MSDQGSTVVDEKKDRPGAGQAEPVTAPEAASTGTEAAASQAQKPAAPPAAPPGEAGPRSFTDIIDSLQRMQQGPVSPPTMLVTPPPPQYTPLQTYQRFGSLATLMGIFGGLLTRQPLITALNAGGAAIHALDQGNIQQYQANFRTWNQATRQAMEFNKNQIEAYKDVLANRRLSQQEKLGQLRAIASMMQNQVMLRHLDSMDAHNVQMFTLQMEKTQQELETQRDRLELAHAKLEADPKFQIAHARDMEWQAAHPNGEPQTPQYRMETAQLAKATGAGGTVQLSDAAIDMLAKRFNQTGQIPSAYRDADTRKRIMERATQLLAEQHHTVGGAIASASSVKADTASLTQLTRMSDSALAYEDTALKNMDVAEGLIDKGAGTPEGTIVNRWLQAGRKATGDADVAKLDAAIKTVTNEYAKVMSGSTGSQAATDSSRQEASDMVNSAQTPEQIRQVFNLMRLDMENRKSALTDQRQIIQRRISGEGTGAGAGATAPAATPAATPLPTVVQGGRQVPDASKLRDGTVYTLPDGRKMRFDQSRETFVPVQ